MSPCVPLVDPPKRTQGSDQIHPAGLAPVGLGNFRQTIGQQIADLERQVLRLARNDARAQRFMTTLGVGAITALCYLATIDDPTRFKKSRRFGAFLGLTTRRFASGEIDWTGRIIERQPT